MVLLVDDDAAFRKVYGSVLREAGVLVSEAADAARPARSLPSGHSPTAARTRDRRR